MCCKLKTKEALDICEKCREKKLKENPKNIDCAFRHDNSFCDRLEDIDTLMAKLGFKGIEND